MWEGNRKEILKKKTFAWEREGKEIFNNFGMGGKCEGNNKFFFRGKETGMKKLGKVSKICQK